MQLRPYPENRVIDVSDYKAENRQHVASSLKFLKPGSVPSIGRAATPERRPNKKAAGYPE
jgi:hypothetical protein